MDVITHFKASEVNKTKFIYTAEPEWLRWLERTLCWALNSWFESPLNACRCASMWIKKAQLQCQQVIKGQQVLHQKWIWGIHCTQISYHASKGFILGFELQGRRHQKSKTEVWVTPQKWLMSSKKLFLKSPIGAGHIINLLVLITKQHMQLNVCRKIFRM